MKTLKVIKIGGNVVDNPDALSAFLRTFASIDGAKILIHGGGKVASTIGRSLGIEPIIIDGRRVTDSETLRVVTMVYGGLINKNIVSALQGMGCNAIGITGADGGLVHSIKRSPSPIDYGYVGDPESVNVDLLQRLLDGGYTPVIAPLTMTASGQMLNTNADTMAQTIATSMASVVATDLIYTFELDGVLDKSGALITNIDKSKAETLKADGTINGGMIPKIDNAISACQSGVKSVLIGKTVIS